MRGWDIDRGGHDRLRAWLEAVAAMAIDWLDDLDAAETDREDDEREPLLSVEEGLR